MPNSHATVLVCPNGHTNGFQKATYENLPSPIFDNVRTKCDSDSKAPVQQTFICSACHAEARHVRCVPRGLDDGMTAYLPVYPEDWILLQETRDGPMRLVVAKYDEAAKGYAFEVGDRSLLVKLHETPAEITFNMSSDMNLFRNAMLWQCPDYCGTELQRTRTVTFEQEITPFGPITDERDAGHDSEIIKCVACRRVAVRTPHLVVDIPGMPGIRLYMPERAPIACMIRDMNNNTVRVHRVEWDCDSPEESTLTIDAGNLRIKFLHWKSKKG